MKNYTKEERDVIVAQEDLVPHKTKKHLWKIDGEYRWANQNAYQFGVWNTDYSNGVNAFTDRHQQEVPHQVAKAIKMGAMPIAERRTHER